MSFSHENSRILARGYNSSDTTYQSSDIVMPVDILEVRADKYVPEGTTNQELYGHQRMYNDPTYGYILNYAADFNRIDYRSSVYDTLGEFIDLWFNYDFVDVFVNYDGSSFVNASTSPSVDADFKCTQMIPDITEELSPIIFEGKARTSNPIDLELLSTNRDKSKATINWIFDK